jgi:hypothetical protein
MTASASTILLQLVPPPAQEMHKDTCLYHLDLLKLKEACCYQFGGEVVTSRYFHRKAVLSLTFNKSNMSTVHKSAKVISTARAQELEHQEDAADIDACNAAASSLINS